MHAHVGIEVGIVKDITMFAVVLLLRTKDGRKRPTRIKVPVLKGELVEELDEVIPADRYYSGPHNYRVYTDPTITFYSDATDVAPLVDPEHLYLIPVSREQRIREFYNTDKKGYVLHGLKTGDKMLFSMSTDSEAVRGRIRYLGRVGGKRGVYFGVEIDKVKW